MSPPHLFAVTHVHASLLAATHEPHLVITHHVMQDLEDGLHHEDDEIAGQQLLSLDRLISIEWATSQSLKLGENDFQPALLLQFATGATTRTHIKHLFAVQCL